MLSDEVRMSEARNWLHVTIEIHCMAQVSLDAGPRPAPVNFRGFRDATWSLHSISFSPRKSLMTLRMACSVSASSSVPWVADTQPEPAAFTSTPCVRSAVR